MTKDKHYQVALIQADGRLDLENGRNRGDRYDLFRPGQSVNDSMQQPHTRAWGGTASGLSIDNIQITSEHNIIMSIGKTQAPILKSVVLESNRTINIPDDFAPGITDVLTIEDSAGRIEMVQISLRISHTYRGDLRVTLRHGSDGAKVFSPNSTDSRRDVLIDKLDVTTGFQGSDAKGPWTLQVSDVGKRDVGKLVYWSLSVRYAVLQ